MSDIKIWIIIIASMTIALCFFTAPLVLTRKSGFASHILLIRPELFESYVILSPALFWNNKEVFEKAQQYAQKHKDLYARVYFATGSTETPPTSPFNWVAHQNAFVTQLQKHQYPNLQLQAEIISGALHETSFPIGFIKAMQWLYSNQDS